ncbi:MAG TPA: hypothetical protein VH062_06455 [Polyangiaceae bacterium]|jgi:uncharacterized membrane protein|nr:hypothetical protein [Polyangiaceae bacterium]
MNRFDAWRALLLLSLSSVAACSSDDDVAPVKPMKDSGPVSCSDAGAGTNFPCDVGAIIQSKCQRCHDTEQALTACLAANSCAQGPFPLTTWSDTRRPFATSRVVDFLAEVIESGTMPLQSNAISPPVETLTADEKTTLLDWIHSCAPASATACP